MMDYKIKTREFYEKYASHYTNRTGEFAASFLKQEMQEFSSKLKGNKVLDIGSGAGRDAIALTKCGLDVTCVDFAPAMIKACKEKGLQAIEMDFEHLDFVDESFDGVWSYTALLHVPKTKIQDIIKNIARILKHWGVFFLGMREGTFEGVLQDDRYEGVERFFARYTQEELERILSKYFTIISLTKTNIKDKTYLNFICRKNGPN